MSPLSLFWLNWFIEFFKSNVLIFIIILLILFLVGKRLFKKLKLNFSFILFVCLSVFLIIYYFFPEVFNYFINKYGVFRFVYFVIKKSFIDRTYFGLFLIFSIGSLFFIFIPLEITYMYFIAKLNPLISFIIVVPAILLGLSVNYFLGKLFARKYAEKHHFLSHLFMRFGAGLLVLFYFTPLPVQVLTFISGALRYNYKKFIKVMLFVVILKYLLLTIYGKIIIEFIMNMIKLSSL